MLGAQNVSNANHTLQSSAVTHTPSLSAAALQTAAPLSPVGNIRLTITGREFFLSWSCELTVVPRYNKSKFNAVLTEMHVF